MADDRPAEEVPDAIGRLTRDFEDFKTTVLHRLTRRPIGDIEPSLRGTAKPGTLLLHGQTVSRTTYADLWKWITDNGLSPSVFGAGDGSTTFVLPELRGKAVVGATVVDPIGKSFGSASVTLTEAMMPLHDHNGTTDWSDRSHYHGGQTDHDGGGHGRHWDGPGFVAAGNNSAPIKSNDSSGSHSHHFTSATENVGHKHGFVTNNAGSSNPTPIFVVQPSYAINWLIWV